MNEELRQKAKEWVKEKIKEKSFGHFPIDCLEAYLAGLHEGQPKWHDLRKDPNDLPKEYTEVLDDEGRQVVLRKGHWRFVYGGDWEDDAIVYAWCEIPQFKE